MAAIDIIKNMSDGELVSYYKYCMDKKFYELRFRGVIYHPKYEHCAVRVGENEIYNLHYGNEMFLLNEMWERMIASGFADRCWWSAQKVFQTKVSLPEQKEFADALVEVVKTRSETLEYAGETFELLASGTKRKTFISPCRSYVIKIPKDQFSSGLSENRKEAETYAKNPDSIYAKCELIENGWLKMEFVRPEYFSKDDDYPDWTLSIAEHQVGYNLDGKLVAYDYGSDI